MHNIKKIRERQNWIYEEVNYRNQLEIEKRQLEEKLLKMKLTLEKEDTDNDLFNTYEKLFNTDGKLPIHEQQILVNQIKNINLRSEYSKVRIKYYTEIAKISIG